MKRKLILLTGLSGAGHSTALKALEDLGYYAVDNLPLDLIDGLIELNTNMTQHMAVGIDNRTHEFTARRFLSKIHELSHKYDLDLKLVFIDCNDDVLTHRFTETRRRHPLAFENTILEGIRHEREILESLKECADLMIDSSYLNIHDMRRLISGQFHFKEGISLSIFITSFSYKKGLPREADFIFDVRFFQNPYYIQELKYLTGTNKKVGEYIAQDPLFNGFYTGLTTLLDPLLKRYAMEDKSYLTIAFGCTGGQHRSVFIAEKLGAWIKDQHYSVSIHHRDAIDNRTP